MSAPTANRIIAFLYRWGDRSFVTIEKPNFTIGRQNGDLIIENDPAVSREHCRLEFKQRTCEIFDLGSSNGTWVNGKQVPQSGHMPINDGDWIKIGDAVFFFTWTQSIPDTTRTVNVLSLFPELQGDANPTSSTLRKPNK